MQKKGQVKTRIPSTSQGMPGAVQREEGGGVLPHTLGESSPAGTLISEPLEL